MAPATKPVSGQSIESVWGTQVHDHAVTRRGVVVALTFPTALTGGAADYTSVLEGDASMVDLAANKITIPLAGVWRLDFDSSASGVGTGTGVYSVRIKSNGSQVGGASGAGIGGGSVRVTGSSLRTLAAGDVIELDTTTAGGAATGTQTYSGARLAVTLEAQALGAS